MGILGNIMGYIMGYNWQYFEKIGYIKQQLIQNLGIYSAKIMEYICKNYGIYFLKVWEYWEKLLDMMGKNGYIKKCIRYIWKNFGIYWAKTIGYIMGCIWQKLRDILG